MNQKVNAQLVFIPDVQLRSWFNNQAPGCVDADGWFNPADPLIQQDTLFILSTWQNADLTGLEALPNARELIIGGGDNMNSPAIIAAWPDSVRRLRIEYFTAVEMPEFPASLRRLELEVFSTSTLPPLPEGAWNVSLINLSGMLTLPPFPNSVTRLYMENCPNLVSLPDWPSGLRHLTMKTLPQLEALPELPDGLEHLWLQDLDQIVEWPILPESIMYLRLSALYGLSGVFPDLPTACTTLVSYGLPLVTEMGSLGPSLQLWEGGGTGITSIPYGFPPSLGSLSLIGMPELTCLPWLHDNMTIYLYNTGVTCLPNVPTNNFTINPEAMLNAPCSILGLECIPPVITGVTYRDLNDNGILDAGEPGLPYYPVVIEPSGGTVFSDGEGFFRSALPPGSYTLTAVPGPYTLSISPPEHTAELVLPSDLDSLNDFGYVLEPDVQDLRIDLAFGQAVSGFEFNAWLVVQNAGTVPVEAEATLMLDEGNSFVESDVPPSLIDGQSTTWSFGTLQPGEQRLVICILHVPPSTPFATLLQNTAVAMPMLGDAEPDDNTATFELEIFGAFDPNDKLVTPPVLSPDELAAGKPITYTIRFQNTGNYPATRVVISDTLSPDLVQGSFEFLSSSHDLTAMSITDGVLLFTYDGIMLPDSTNDEPGSHGYVRFRMSARPDLQLNDEVHNVANIYFDFNDPVITEPAVVRIDEITGIATSIFSGPQVYPVPTADMLQVRFPGTNGTRSWTILDAAGRIHDTGTTSGEQFHIDVSQLADGAYLLRMLSDGRTAVARFVKN